MNEIKKFASKLKNVIIRKSILPDHVPQNLLIQQAADYFNFPKDDVIARYKDYRQYHVEQQYEMRLGERKTLCFEEAFLLYLCILRMHPKQIVEIGTQYGKSTRRIIDLLHFAGITNCKITCFDIVDQVKYFSPEEADLKLYDVTNNFQEHVLLKLNPELIFLDARPYWLLFHVISKFLAWSENHISILAIHDCSPRLYKPHMKIPKTEAGLITSRTGVWERHVLREVFQVPNRLLDDLNSPTHYMKIFNTPHGLSIISPKNKGN